MSRQLVFRLKPLLRNVFTPFLLVIFSLGVLCAQTAEDYMQKANELAKKGKTEPAIEQYVKALSIDPHQKDAYINIAWGYLRLGMANEGWGALEAGLIHDPERSGIYLSTWGNILYFYRQYADAIHTYDAALDEDISDSLRVFILSYRAWSKRWEKDFEGAVEDLRQYHMKDSSNVDITAELGFHYFYIGNVPESLRLMKKACLMDSSNAVILMNIGFVLEQIGEYEQAEKYLIRALKKKPNDPYILNNLGYAKLKTGNMAQAIKLIEKSLKLDPENCYAYRNRALYYLEKGEKEKACEDLNRARDLGYGKYYDDQVYDLLKENCPE